MPESLLHISTEMTGDRAEDTSRRAQTFKLALEHAAADPATKLKMALGSAYNLHHAGVSRSEIRANLQDIIDEPGVRSIAIAHRNHLATVVAARTRGQICGDYIGKFNVELLNEALETEDPPDAA